MPDPVTPSDPARPAAPAARTVAPPPGPPDPAPPETVSIPAFITAAQSAVPNAIEPVVFWVGDWSLIVSRPRLFEVATHLRDAEGARFDLCSDVTATDWPVRAERFDVVYALYSTSLRHRVRLKVRVPEAEGVQSVAAVWPAA